MRSVLLATVLTLVSTAAAAQSGDEDPAPVDEPTAQTLTEAIAALDKADPSSPEALNVRLEYVDFLIAAHTGDCQQRLDAAQSQLDTAASDPAFEVVLPAALARQADLEYRIHTARASCGSDPSQRPNELHQALAAAQRAIELYRDALDYQSMTVMQFNVGVTQRLLGNDAAAVAALRATIDLDREFGFRDDAAENTKLLAQWTGNSAAPAVVRDIPTRTTTLKFGWSIRNAQVAMELSYARVIDGAVARYQGARTFGRTYRMGLLNWQVSDDPGQVVFHIPEWPRSVTARQVLDLAFGEAQLQVPDIEVTKAGDFARAMRLTRLSQKLSKATRALFLKQAESQHPHGPSRVPSALAREFDLSFEPATIEAKAAEDYNFGTAIWIGATLEQGVWYTMTAPLIVPASLAVTVSQDIEFAYTRQVPCNADSTDRSCVELVVHARPEADALEALTAGLTSALKLPQGMHAHYSSATAMRIVADPDTLITHVRDVRNYWHISFDGAAPDAMANQSERLVVTESGP